MPTSITAHTFFFNYSRAMEDDEIFHSIIASSPEDDDLFPRTVEDIFNDFTGRRSGFLRALTADVDRFYSLCGSEMEILCLYAYPNGTWEVNNPPEVLPLSLLQPVIGINFARDSMPRVDWLDFIAVHSDSWLFALSSYFSASARLSRDERNRLFDLINELPTLAEIMSSSAYSPTLFKMMTSSAYYGR